ncbi:hypothetical protein [Segnochrobactrum spirostomi]|uniref:Nuclear transport factor 2 family protein n=1 Tax=Segnochrobactrum spirostomi TaxID=2608987 RepID=A0A6A7Y5S4_9HYPH|nr:hypothetical protein [Segnochrobactrum spirostomi]MQT14126.1 hypothetical protein [Segnochrobactrum spirostomi]
MGSMTNPFADDADRRAIWTMLVERDIDAFLGQDWGMVEGDFIAAGFSGIHAHFEANPDRWTMAFPTLEAYRDEWLRQAAATAATGYAEPLRDALFRATDLSEIEINGARAIAHKKFDGTVARADGGIDRLDWQTLYFCAKTAAGWKITGFVGYMPRRLGAPA